MRRSGGREAGRPRVAILLDRAKDAARWRERHAAGETMDVTPYGYELAADRFDLVWATAAPEGRVSRAVRVRVANRLGFDLVHAWRNRRLLFGADVIWTHTEREHLAVALLQRLKRPSRRVPVLAQSVWLWDAWQDWGRARRAFVAWLLRTHPVEAVHSAVNRDVSSAEVPGRTVTLLPFGSAAVTREVTPIDRVPPLVVAVGNDADRDWSVLAEAIRRLEGLELRIASKSAAARREDWPAGVSPLRTATAGDLAELYRSASVVVIPLRPNLHASGTTSCIEALAARRPLVVTDAGGLPDYVGAAATVVPAGDADALAAAIAATVARATPPPGDPWTERGLTQADYVERYVLLTRWLLGEIPWPESVSAFAPVRPPSAPSPAAESRQPGP